MYIIIYHEEKLPLGLQELLDQYNQNPTDELAHKYNNMLRDFRRNFELPCWPYNDEDHMEHFKEFLRDNKIFLYNDLKQWDGGKNVDGPIWSYEEDYYNNFDVSKTYYRSLVWLVMNDNSERFLMAATWPYDDPEGRNLQKKIQEDPIANDELAWGELNKEERFLEVEYLQPIRRDLKFSMEKNPINNLIKPDVKIKTEIEKKE